MEGLFVKRSRPLTIGVPRLGTGTEDQALSGVIVRCLIMHGCTLGRVSVAAHARRSEIATIRVLAGHGSSGNPELPADPVAPARFRVLATPGLADGFAADDIVELATLGNARVLKRGGNLGVQVYSRAHDDERVGAVPSPSCDRAASRLRSSSSGGRDAGAPLAAPNRLARSQRARRAPGPRRGLANQLCPRRRHGGETPRPAPASRPSTKREPEGA